MVPPDHPDHPDSTCAGQGTGPPPDPTDPAASRPATGSDPARPQTGRRDDGDARGTGPPPDPTDPAASRPATGASPARPRTGRRGDDGDDGDGDGQQALRGLEGVDPEGAGLEDTDAA